MSLSKNMKMCSVKIVITCKNAYILKIKAGLFILKFIFFRFEFLYIQCFILKFLFLLISYKFVESFAIIFCTQYDDNKFHCIYYLTFETL